MMVGDQMTEPEPGPTTALVLLVAAVVLCPYFTITLSFRNALMVQAALVTALILLIGVLPTLASRRAPRLRQVPVVARHVAIVWMGVGVLGTVVGIVRGNDPVLLMGQLLALALLPLGILAGAAIQHTDRWQTVTRGIVGGTIIGAAVSIAASLGGLVEDQTRAMYLPNHVSVTGSFLLAALLYVGAAPQTSDLKRRLLRFLALAILGVYLLMLGSRSLLLLTPVCVVTWAILARNTRPVRTLAAALVGAAVSLCLLFSVVLHRTGEPVLSGGSVRLVGTVGTPLPDVLVLPLEGESATIDNIEGDQIVLASQRIEIPDSGAYRFGGEIRGAGAGTGYLGIRWLDNDGRLLGIERAYATARGQWQTVHRIVRNPNGSTAMQVIVGTKDGSPGTWSFRMPTVTYLGSTLVVTFHRQWSSLTNRYGRLAELALLQGITASPSLAFRVKETQTVWSRLVDAPLAYQLLGHGLGATFEYRFGSFKDTQRTRESSHQNYIHNHYMYLLFKVGVVGAVLIIGATGYFLWSLWSTVRAHPPGRTRGRVAAVTAAWIGYLVWGIVAPELADFRIAPLWGLAIAAAAGESGDDGK
jgi:hypothetical protein